MAEEEEMEKGFKSLSHSAQRFAVSGLVDGVIRKTPEKRQKSIAKIVDLAEMFLGNSIDHSSFQKVKDSIRDTDNKWWRLINHMLC